MKKSTKTFTGSLAALASVASIIAPAATVLAEGKTAAEVAVDHVAYAEKTLNFFDFNLAYSKVVALGDKHPQYFELLARLGKVEETVKTPEIKAVLKAMDDLAANKDLANYTKLEKLIADTIKEEKNNLYLRGELNTWGHEMVYTADVKAAIDAVNAAWLDKTPAKIAAAKEAVAKVKNAGSLAWLNEQVTEIQKTLAVSISEVKAIKAKSLKVSFNKAVDTTKAAISLKKGTVAVNVSEIVFAEDKMSAEIKLATALTKGDYTVSVTGLADAALTGTVTVEDQKVAAIEVSNEKAASVRDAQANITSAKLGYKVVNQYGEDVTKATWVPEITWTASVGNATDDNQGTITLAAPAVHYSLDQSVTLTGVMNNGVNVMKQIKIGAPATVETLSFIGVYNANSKALNTDTIKSETFQLLIEAKDQYGNKLNAAAINQDMVITSLNPAIANVAATVADSQGKDSDKVGVALTAPTGTGIDGKVVIRMISNKTGKSYDYEIEVTKAATVTTFNMTAPSTVVAQGETVEIPFTAADQYGNAVTSFSALDGKVTFPSNNNANGILKFENDYVNKKAVLKYTAPAAKGTYFLMAVADGKVSQFSLEVKDTAEAKVLSKVSGLTTVLAKDGTSSISIDNLTVNDQHGREMDLDDTFFANYSIKIEAADGTADKVSVSAGTVAYIDAKGDKATLKGIADGSEKIKLSVTNKSHVAIAGSEYELIAKTVKDDTLVSFELGEIGVISNKDANHAVALNVYGIQADNTKVILPTTKYNVTTTLSGLNYVNGKLDATNVSTGYSSTTNEQKTEVVVVVYGYNGPVTLKKEVTLSNAALKPVTLANKTVTDVSFADGVLKVSASNAVNEAKLISSFEAKDQYGKVFTITSPKLIFTNLVDADKDGLLQVDANNGLPTADLTGAEEGDTFTLTVVLEGLTKSVKVVVTQ